MIQDLINALNGLEDGELDCLAHRLSPGVWDAGRFTKIHRDGEAVWVYIGDLEVIGFQASEMPRLIAALFQAYMSTETDRENHQPTSPVLCRWAWPSEDLTLRHFCTRSAAHPEEHRCSCGAEHAALQTPGLRRG